jgi:hypothetical protein
MTGLQGSQVLYLQTLNQLDRMFKAKPLVYVTLRQAYNAGAFPCQHYFDGIPPSFVARSGPSCFAQPIFLLL